MRPAKDKSRIPTLSSATLPAIVTNIVGNAFLPKTAEAFYYDLDGNLTGDGRCTNSWDGENRLVKLTSLTNGPSGSKRRLSFTYDYQGRRIGKQVETWNGSAWSVTLSNKFVYDGWNLIAELNGTNNAVIRSYLWGTDLSGAAQGAGGVGGLLAVKSADLGVQNFVAFDGNGNVAALVNAADGTVSASYEYGPFGEVLRRAGPIAAASPIRFSTKYQDDETDYLYYGYRYYNPSMGRWVSRDPIAESGGLNLFNFASGNAINSFDTLGTSAEDEQRSVVMAALQRNLASYGELGTPRVTGLTHLMEAFSGSVLPNISVRFSTKAVRKIDKKAAAVYQPKEKVLYFLDSGLPNLSETSHELTHAFVDLFTTIRDSRTDEGVATTAGEMVSIVTSSVMAYESFLRNNNNDCGADDPKSAARAMFKTFWTKLWRQNGSPSGVGWQPGQYQNWYGSFEPFTPVRRDFDNLERITGLKLKCSDIARVFNGVLESKGCCLRFGCGKSSSDPLTIAAGVEIQDPFK